jgi:hypothetical protein
MASRNAARADFDLPNVQYRAEQEVDESREDHDARLPLHGEEARAAVKYLAQ